MRFLRHGSVYFWDTDFDRPVMEPRECYNGLLDVGPRRLLLSANFAIGRLQLSVSKLSSIGTSVATPGDAIRYTQRPQPDLRLGTPEQLLLPGGPRLTESFLAANRAPLH